MICKDAKQLVPGHHVSWWLTVLKEQLCLYRRAESLLVELTNHLYVSLSSYVREQRSRPATLQRKPISAAAIQSLWPQVEHTSTEKLTVSSSSVCRCWCILCIVRHLSLCWNHDVHFSVCTCTEYKSTRWAWMSLHTVHHRPKQPAGNSNKAALTTLNCSWIQ